MNQTFDEWWVAYWQTNGLPSVMNLAFKEIAQKAWNAALQQQKTLEPKFSLISEFYD